MGQKTLESITIYLSWQDKMEIEDEARQNNLSVSNLVRLKIGLPKVKVGRKKLEVFANESSNFGDFEVIPMTKPTPPDHHCSKTIQHNLFDCLDTET